MNSEWTSNLKAGDVVIVKDGGYYGTRKIVPVERITPSGRIVAGGRVFKPDGSQYGGNPYYSVTILEATPEIIESIRQNEKIENVLKTMHGVRSISYEQSVEIEKILNTSQEDL